MNGYLVGSILHLLLCVSCVSKSYLALGSILVSDSDTHQQEIRGRDKSRVKVLISPTSFLWYCSRLAASFTGSPRSCLVALPAQPSLSLCYHALRSPSPLHVRDGECLSITNPWGFPAQHFTRSLLNSPQIIPLYACYLWLLGP